MVQAQVQRLAEYGHNSNMLADLFSHLVFYVTPSTFVSVIL